jgi:hypothetical protein
MWWKSPKLGDFEPIFPDNVLEVLVRSHAIVEVGELSGTGPERGRNFEQLFYSMCDRQGIHLSERAGARSVAGQYSASGFAHEVDGATHGFSFNTHWELKHLSSLLPKNELLIFNGKGLDFLQGVSPMFSRTPLLRFLLSGANIRDECRYYGVLWGITVIEPGRLPFPLIYEAVARNCAGAISDSDRDAVRHQVPWAFRPLQSVLSELSKWCVDGSEKSACGSAAIHRARELIDMQEQIGGDILDSLEDYFPDWVDEVAQETWRETGGW